MIFDRYMFKDLGIAALFVAVILAVIILLTQSLRFLELVINAGASGMTFWILTVLAMPRFFEIILPIAMMAATLFVYNRMTMDSELIVMRATGASPMMLARPAIGLSLAIMAVMIVLTGWLTPLSLSNMEYLRAAIKAQYSTMLFREGVFNAVGDGLTVFVREREPSGELRGLMIHDNRKQNPTPVTILAKRGMIAMSGTEQKVIVYEGSRQSFSGNGTLNRLDFDRYTIDMPEGSGPTPQHAREPEERTLPELLRPSAQDRANGEIMRNFRAEINRRLIGPLLSPAFTLLALVMLLIGPVDRRGQGWRVAAAVTGAVLIEGFYLGTYNVARHSTAGLLAMYALVVVPIAASLFFLDSHSEGLRRRWFYPCRTEDQPT